MQFRILGPLEARTTQGELAALTACKHRVLLSVLQSGRPGLGFTEGAPNRRHQAPKGFSMFSNRRRWLPLLAAGAISASGVIALTPGKAMAVSCNQPTAAWLATPDGTLANGNTVREPPQGMKVWPVGITVPGDTITFKVVPVLGPTTGFIDPRTGATSLSYTTVAANGNCVVNQPSNSDAPTLLVNSAFIQAKITNWKNGQVETIDVGEVVQG